MVMGMKVFVLVFCVAGAVGFAPGSAAADFFAKAGLQTISKAWEKWSRSTNDHAWPSIKMHISEPPVGVKVTPAGVHPKKYLQELPDLQHYIVEDGQVYYYDQDGNQIFISSEMDWISFFGAHDGFSTTKTLFLTFSTPNVRQQTWWQSGAAAVQKVSDKLRTFGKTLMMGENVERSALEQEQVYLENQGFTAFSGKGAVFEELGFSKEDWPEYIDTLVEAGIPEVWGKTLKLAAKAKRGSVKSLATNSFADGVRQMHYMKFQVLPDGEGGVDGLFAIYTLKAKTEIQSTGIKTEQSFKRFVELDAHQQWKQEVRQFLPESPAQPASEDL